MSLKQLRSAEDASISSHVDLCIERNHYYNQRTPTRHVIGLTELNLANASQINNSGSAPSFQVNTGGGNPFVYNTPSAAAGQTSTDSYINVDKTNYPDFKTYVDSLPAAGRYITFSNGNNGATIFITSEITELSAHFNFSVNWVGGTGSYQDVFRDESDPGNVTFHTFTFDNHPFPSADYLYSFRNVRDFKSSGTDKNDHTHFNELKVSHANKPFLTGFFSFAVAARDLETGNILDLSGAGSIQCRIVQHTRTDDEHTEGSTTIEEGSLDSSKYSAVCESFSSQGLSFSARPQPLFNKAEPLYNSFGIVFTLPGNDTNSLLSYFDNKNVVIDLYAMVFDINTNHFDIAKGSRWEHQ